MIATKDYSTEIVWDTSLPFYVAMYPSAHLNTETRMLTSLLLLMAVSSITKNLTKWLKSNIQSGLCIADKQNRTLLDLVGLLNGQGTNH